jgi:Kef-type K+ transport system membrane component KefB
VGHELSIIITLSLVIIFSPFFAKLLRLPTTPIEIIFGSVFGYIGFLQHSELFELVAEFGFLYLMFIAGTEVNLKKVLTINSITIRRILIYMGLLYFFSIIFSLYFHLGNIFMVLLPLISVGLIATLSKEYGKTPWIVLGMTAGGLGEVVSITGITLASAALEHGTGVEFFEIIASLALFIVSIVIIFKALQLLFWWFPEISTVLMPHSDNQEQDIRLSIGTFFLLISVMIFLDLEVAFGAFIAGMFIPTFFEHKHQLPEKIASFGFGFVVPIFFVYIGSSFNLDAIFMEGLLLKALLIALGMIAMRVISAGIFVPNIGHRNSILLGLSHGMPLTLLIAMATLAYHANSIDQLHYYAFILGALFQVIIVMVTIKIINIEPKPSKN